MLICGSRDLQNPSHNFERNSCKEFWYEFVLIFCIYTKILKSIFVNNLSLAAVQIPLIQIVHFQQWNSNNCYQFSSNTMNYGFTSTWVSISMSKRGNTVVCGTKYIEMRLIVIIFSCIFKLYTIYYVIYVDINGFTRTIIIKAGF